MEELKKLKKQVQGKKTTLTKSYNYFCAIDNPSNDKIIMEMEKICSLKKDIVILFAEEVQIMYQHELNSATTVQDDVDKCVDVQTVYISEVEDRIIELKSRLEKLPNTDETRVVSARNRAPYEFQLPKINIKKFADNEDDPCKYLHFKNIISNALSSIPNIDNKQKFIYLKTVLEGRAFSLADSLHLTDSSYEDAIKLLDNEFLHEKKIINIIFDSIAEYPVTTDLKSANKFISHLRSKVEELKKFGLDATDGESLANQYMSRTYRLILPQFYVTELVRRSCPFPLYDDIMKHSADLELFFSRQPTQNKNPRQEATKTNKYPQTNTNESYQIRNSKQNYPNNSSSQGNVFTKMCKFCQAITHSSIACKKYPNYEDRIKRTTTLNLCVRCLSSQHAESGCPGKFGKISFPCFTCQLSTHVSPMCPKYSGIDKSKTSL